MDLDFLSTIKEFRWVILQDAALLMNKGRNNFLFDVMFKGLSHSEFFREIQNELVKHCETNSLPPMNETQTGVIYGPVVWRYVAVGSCD